MRKLGLLLINIIQLLFLLSDNINAQCENNIQYPNDLFIAPDQGDTLIISGLQFAGDYVEMAAFQKDFEYYIFSDGGSDFITVRSDINNDVLAYGLAPLLFIPVTDTVVTIHFNLSDPVCGTDTNTRQTSITNNGLPVNSDINVGINTIDPLATLDVNGKIKLGDDEDEPVEGMIRYNIEEQDFEGYDGVCWRSLTTASDSWGEVSESKVAPAYTLSIHDENNDSNFGKYIDHEENTLVVSCSDLDVDDNIDQGRIYIFENLGEGYVLQDSLDDPNGSEDGQFGNLGVAINNNYILVRSSHNLELNDGSTNSTITIFRREGNDWLLDEVISDIQGDAKQYYAYGASINPPYATISGVVDDLKHVFVFKRDINGAWSEIQSIANPSDQENSTFGNRSIIDNPRLFISDPLNLFEVDMVENYGLIYVFENDGTDHFQLVDSILADTQNGDGNHLFGTKFNVDEDYLVVADPITSPSISIKGAVDVYHYENFNWNKSSTIYRPPGTRSEWFGRNVDIINNEVVIASFNNIFIKSYHYQMQNQTFELTSKLGHEDHRIPNLSDVAIGDDVIFNSFISFNEDVPNRILVYIK